MERKGICNNIGLCNSANSHKIIIITDDDAPFECPDCHEQLTEYVEEEHHTNTKNTKTLIGIIIATVFIIIIGIIIALFAFGWKKTNLRKEINQSVASKVNLATQKNESSENVNAAISQTKTSKKEFPVASRSIDVTSQQQHQPNVSSPKLNSNNSQRSSSSNDGSINLGYAVYDGPSSGGRPNGIGTLTFKHSYSISLEDGQGSTVEASAGDKMFMAKFKNGRLIQGELHRNNGERISVIVGN